MKKLLVGSVISVFIFFFASCVDEQIVIPTTPPQGKILIDSNPRNASILFLGTASGKFTPDSIMNIESGTYDITLMLEGYRDTTFNVTVLNNYKTTKFIKLLPVRLSGTISVNSEPAGAQIFLSGTSTGKITPDSLPDLTPGIYSITLKLNGYKDSTFSANVVNGNRTPINIILNDTLPEPDVNVTYRSIQFNQRLFSFVFNQDIYIERIVSKAPLSDSTTTNEFQNELIMQGEEVVLAFQYVPGTWNFTIYGKKAGGDIREFIITKQIFVL